MDGALERWLIHIHQFHRGDRRERKSVDPGVLWLLSVHRILHWTTGICQASCSKEDACLAPQDPQRLPTYSEFHRRAPWPASVQLGGAAMTACSSETQVSLLSRVLPTLPPTAPLPSLMPQEPALPPGSQLYVPVLGEARMTQLHITLWPTVGEGAVCVCPCWN